MRLALVFLLFALSHVPQTTDQATVYIYRVEEASKLDSRKVKVKLNDKPLLEMPEDSFIALRLPSGEYGLRLRQKQSETLLKVEAGKTYYVRVSQVPAGFGFNQSIHLMPPEQATFQMREMRPLEDKNIKNKTVEVVKDRPAIQSH